MNLFCNDFFLNYMYLQIHTTTVIMQKKVTRDSMYIFRNELELVCLVIGWGGGVSDYLFGVGGGIE